MGAQRGRFLVGKRTFCPQGRVSLGQFALFGQEPVDRFTDHSGDAAISPSRGDLVELLTPPLVEFDYCPHT